MDRSKAEVDHPYRLLVEHLGDYAVFMLDLNGRITSWNDGACAIFAYTPQEALGQPGSILFTPEDTARDIPSLEMQTASSQGRASDERWHIRKDGKRFFASGVMTCLRDEHGTQFGYAKVLRDLTERRLAEQRLATEHAIARVLAEASTLSDAMPRTLEAICQTSGWEWGALWTVDETSDVLRCADIWHVAGADVPKFEQMSINSTFARGIGLPGRVFASGQPAWINDLSEDNNFPRRLAAIEGGLHGAFCFPVLLGSRVIGVMEFFSREIRPPDNQMLTMMLVVGGQMGQFMDRRRSERLLLGSEARNAAVLQTALDCIVSMDHLGNVVEWNPVAERTFGYSRQEAIGRELAELIIPPELKDTHRAGLVKYLISGQGPVIGKRIEITAVGKNRDSFPVELAITRVPLPGPPVFIGYLREITERVQAEESLRESAERLRLGLDAGNTGTWDWDILTNHVTWSERVYEFHGVKPGQFAGTVEEFARIIHPDDADRVQAAIQHSLSTAAPYAIEFRVRHPDGSVHWLTTNGRVFFDDTRKPIRMMGATNDITQRKLVEQERDRLLESERAARIEAERASRLKDDFLATVSHELRTPLNAILGYAQLLQMGPIESREVTDGLAVIERNARVQTQIIEDILDMSRVVSGKLRLDVQRVSLVPVIEAALETVQPAADAKIIRLLKTLDPLAGPVSGDPGRLQQILWNLLSNAIKFTPKGGKVHVILARVNSHVEITVSDNGQGIAPEFLPFVFEKFRQADASASRSHGGLGLGLSIVKSLVELHGGTVEARSAGEGHGATFVLTLPLSPLHADTFPDNRLHPASPGMAPVPRRLSLQDITVLSVDDEPDALALVKHFLENCGAQVITALGAKEALNALDHHTVHVILSDIGMPGTDGYEFIRLVRARGANANGDVPAAALTAFSRSEDRTRALIAGYQTHIAKPVEPTELIAAVASLVNRTGRHLDRDQP